MSRFRKTTFGELKAGDQFALSGFGLIEQLADNGQEPIMNIKLPIYGVVCNADGSLKDEFKDYPFNVVCLRDGSPRTFKDHEIVYVESK